MSITSKNVLFSALFLSAIIFLICGILGFYIKIGFFSSLVLILIGVFSPVVFYFSLYKNNPHKSLFYKIMISLVAIFFCVGGVFNYLDPTSTPTQKIISMLCVIFFGLCAISGLIRKDNRAVNSHHSTNQ